MKASVSAGKLSIAIEVHGELDKSLLTPLQTVTVFGVSSKPSNVMMGGMHCKFTYDSSSKKLTVTGLEEMTTMGAWSQNWDLTWL